MFLHFKIGYYFKSLFIPFASYVQPLLSILQ